MTEPTPNPTPTPAPAPAPPPAPAPSPTPAPPPASVSRPEWLPEAHWDQTANTIKPEFGQHYAEVSTFYQTETEKRNALAARKPEDIKFEVKLPETVKVPEGMDLKINEADPRVPIIREMAIKRGWDQDTVNELVALDAQQQIAAHAAEQTRIAAADAKLGANANERKAAVGNWLKGMKDRNELSGEEYEAVKVYATDAETVTALEKIIAKASGSIPGHAPGNPPPPAQVPQAERWYGATTPKKVS
jgi:hypothetical protein